jgi:hypothetical protein
MPPVFRKRISKHVPAATNTHATIELLETVFYTRSVQKDYKERQLGQRSQLRGSEDGT